MKTLNVVLSNEPSAQWEAWINALVRAGLEVKVVDPMKTLNVVLSNEPSAQWEEWINALVCAGYEVKVIEPSGTRSNAYEVLPGDAILLDGMLPHLRRFAGYLQRLFPGLPTIVATETDSFTIKYEVMELDNARYVSGPLSAEQFVETIGRIIECDQILVA